MDNIPMYKTAIEFNLFMALLNEEKGYDYRDMARRWDVNRRSAILDEVNKQFNITNTTWVNSAAGRTETENKAWEVYYKLAYDTPYQDVWHWLLDNDFCDVENGKVSYLSNDYLNDPDTPDYVVRVLNDIFEACEGHKALKKGKIKFYIFW